MEDMRWLVLCEELAYSLPVAQVTLGKAKVLQRREGI
jgi:hypothetical protein